MASGMISKAELKCVGKTITLPANEDNVGVTANTIDGYSFVCWLSVATEGFVGSAYVLRPEDASSIVWVVGSKTSSARNLRVTALYSKL